MTDCFYLENSILSLLSLNVASLENSHGLVWRVIVQCGVKMKIEAMTWPGSSTACHSYVGSWTMTILTFLVDVPRHLPPGTQRSRSPRRSGPRLSLVLCGLLQKSPASLPPRWNISMLACLDKTRQVYFRINYIHTLLDHRCLITVIIPRAIIGNTCFHKWPSGCVGQLMVRSGHCGYRRY